MPRPGPSSSRYRDSPPSPRAIASRSQGSVPTVLLLIDELEDWRGTETHLFRLVQRLDPRRLRPVIAIVGRRRLTEAFREARVPVFPLQVRGLLAPSGLRGLARIVALLRRERARLLVSYHTTADLLGPLAAGLAGIPAISCRRDEGFTKKPAHVAVQRRLNRFIHGMISVSGAVARAVERIEGFPLDRNRVIWNGEDLQVFRPGPSPLRRELGLAPDVPVVTCVGGLEPVKDHATLLAAFARVLPRHPEARLLLVGEGSRRAHLEGRARPLGDRVRFLGHRSDVAEVLRASDVYAQTSTTEGFSNAVLQAMATALPVVVTRVGGNPELVDDSSGILVEPGDVGSTARAVSHLLEDRARRRALGAAARRRVEAQGSIEAMADAYTDAFECAMAGDLRAAGAERPLLREAEGGLG